MSQFLTAYKSKKITLTYRATLYQTSLINELANEGSKGVIIGILYLCK